MPDDPTLPPEHQTAGRLVGRAEALSRFEGLDAALWSAADRLFPVRLTRSWAERVRRADDALGRQVFPHPAELAAAPGDVPDPVGEAGLRPRPFLVQKHADRVLLLVTRHCHLYCRYCFRRDQHDGRDPSESELDEALDWARQSGARELILSGGDPLTLPDSRLFAILDAARPALPVVRIHSRAPITAPDRVTPALVAGLRARAPVWMLVHCNHPDELSPPVLEALGRMVDAGLPVLNQAVLLRGVNDDVDVLVALSDALLRARVFPYYLHHTDPVPGNAAFRVDLEAGLRIYEALRGRLSGIGLPRYVIDPPDGSGKQDVADWVRGGRFG
jgi:lysine 2,3-aminomutase